MPTEALFVGTVSFIAGLIIGQFVQFRRVELPDHHKVLVPELDRRPLRGGWFRLALIVLFLTGTGFLVNFTFTQRECNARLWSSITTRSQISDAANANRIANEQASADMVRALLEIDPDDPDADERSAALLRAYLAKVEANNKISDDAQTRRDEHPIPQCL